MTSRIPSTDLDTRYSSPGASATSWNDARTVLESAELYWLSTVRPDGRPHVTSMIGVWQDDALHFSTGAEERKNRNLETNAHCVVTTGCNTLNAEGIDIVLECDAIRVRDRDSLQRLADAYRSKYGWEYTVGDEVLLGAQGNVALVYAGTPTTAFGFGKGKIFSQTRWRFTE